MISMCRKCADLKPLNKEQQLRWWRSHTGSFYVWNIDSILRFGCSFDFTWRLQGKNSHVRHSVAPAQIIVMDLFSIFTAKWMQHLRVLIFTITTVWRSSNGVKKPDSTVDSVEVKTIHLSRCCSSSPSNNLAHWFWFWSQVSNEGLCWERTKVIWFYTEVRARVCFCLKCFFHLCRLKEGDERGSYSYLPLPLKRRQLSLLKHLCDWIYSPQAG